MLKSCETCFNYLGGVYACCRINLEKECKEGEYEAWEPKKGGRIHAEGDDDAGAVPARD